jgi:hypothetical protein
MGPPALFDVPETRSSTRARLRRYLRLSERRLKAQRIDQGNRACDNKRCVRTIYCRKLFAVPSMERTPEVRSADALITPDVKLARKMYRNRCGIGGNGSEEGY